MKIRVGRRGRNTNILILPLLAFAALGPLSAQGAERPINVLFLMTDQQRWDAMSCAGNEIIRTPNFDRLAREGARFTQFYSSLPTCAPARTTMLTGRSIEFTKVTGNGDVARKDIPDLLTFDQVLLRHGYRGEYHGKWHSPYQFARDYTQPVRWLNAKGAPEGTSRQAVRSGSEADAYREYLEASVPPREPRPGEAISRVGPYTPVPLDPNFGKAAPGQVEADDERGEGNTYGRLEVPAEHSLAAWTAGEGLEAMERLKDGPFTLTISIGPPHPPMVVAEPYFSRYAPVSLPVPASIGDPLDNSPYSANKGAGPESYRRPDNIRDMTSIYYAMVTEVDDWIGKILNRLDELGLADRTLVIFTSDHGEMLGEHGMHGKGVFYQGAVHVPLLMRLPHVIPAGTVVTAPAAQIDVFATILDYCGLPGYESQGSSLRPLVEGRENGAGRIAVSELANAGESRFMVFDGRWKFLFGRAPDDPSLDALYDLQTDPLELTNRIGRNPDREKYRSETERMKSLLVAWLARAKSPSLEGVSARAAITDSSAPAKKPKRNRARKAAPAAAAAG